MAYSLVWLPQVLLDAGLKVAEVPGWQTRGNGDVSTPEGVLCHHTAGPRSGNMPSLRVLVSGRRDLRGPLSQLGLGRDGTFYVIAAGKAYHAGKGIWAGVSQGNAHFIGIEAEHTGKPDDPWPEKQLLAYQHGVAALLKHIGHDAERCAGHKEYAPRRKPDPTFDMNEFRAAVREIIAGEAPVLSQIPAAEPDGQRRPTLRRGAVDQEVSVLQRVLGLPSTGAFDAQLEARVREFQRRRGLVADGIVGPKSWAELAVLLRAA